MIDRIIWNTNLKEIAMKKILWIAALALLVAVIAGCGNDAPVQSRDKSGAQLLNMPDQFNTVATKCDGHGHRLYESSGSDAGMAVINDPSCNHVGP
jgi:hypothetical protein